MNFAFVDKLLKEKNGVKFLQVRQDLFVRTVDAMATKIKDSEETLRVFSTMITGKKRRKKIGLTRRQSLLGSFKKFALLMEYESTLQGVRPRLHLLIVQYDH